MATAMGVLASTGALRTHISQLFSFFLVHLLEIYTCLSNTRIYSTLGGTDDDDDSEEGISKDKVEEEKVIRFRASAAQNAFWRICVKGYHFFHPFSS